MNQKDTDISSLLVNLDKKERRYRRRSILYILFIFIIGLIWLLWTGFQVNQLRTESADLKIESEDLKNKIQEMQSQIQFLENSLHEADNFKQSQVNISDTELKRMYSDLNDRNIVNLYMQIKELQYRNIKFALNGSTPDEGFNSPSMVSYILKQNGIIDNIVLNSGKLTGFLPAASGDLKPGDIIVYEAGYSMFFFSYKDRDNNGESKEFCVGMTPFGILELNVDFANRINVLRPDYSNLR